MIRTILTLLKDTYLNPCPLFRSIRFNLLRGKTYRTRYKAILLTSYSVIDIAKTASIYINSKTFFGFKKYKGSHLETSLWMASNSTLTLGLQDDNNAPISIYHGCDIQIFKGAELSIGKGCILNRNAQIICQENVSIGEGCLISRDVVIRDNDGGHSILTEGYRKTSPVSIGNHVWIGQGAMILKGSVIGDGAIIGAGALVAGKVKANSLVMADPSRTFAKDILWEE